MSTDKRPGGPVAAPAHPANGNRPSAASGAEAHARDYVTLMLGDQMFGLPIDQVHDVFIASQIACVPLAPREIVGLLNLRGRVVTALSLRARLGMPELAKAEPAAATSSAEADAGGGTRPVAAPSGTTMAIGIEHHGEAYALMVDRIGEVLRVDAASFEPNPIHLDPAWMALSSGVHRLEERLLIILDVEAVLDFDADIAA
jgi:purine-binding chemotaxis protein CheW